MAQFIKATSNTFINLDHILSIYIASNGDISFDTSSKLNAFIVHPSDASPSLRRFTQNLHSAAGEDNHDS